MSSEIGALRFHHLRVIQLEELSQAVAVRAPGATGPPYQHVRKARAARRPRARAGRPDRAAAALRRDQVVRGPRVRPVVQLVDGYVDACAPGDWLTENVSSYITAVRIYRPTLRCTSCLPFQSITPTSSAPSLTNHY